MRAIKTMFMLLGLVGGFVIAAIGAGTDLPFYASFETNSLGQLGSPWVASLPVVVTNAPTSPDENSTNVAYSADQVSLPIESLDNYYSNVWWHGYSKVHVHTNDLAAAGIDGAAAGFYLRDTGALMAYSNDNWVAVATNVATSGWLGFSVELDYVNKRWNLYKSADGFQLGDTLEIVNKSGPLKFNENYTVDGGLTNIQITGETYIDNITVAVAYQEISNTPTPDREAVVGDTVTLMLDDSTSGVLLTYFAPGERTLSGAFGDALGSMLRTNETISIYIPTNNPSWQMYRYNGSGWIQLAGSAGTDYSITSSMGFYFNLVDDTARTAIFVAGYEQVADPAPATKIYGRNKTGGGWNLLAVPMNASAPEQISNGNGNTLFAGFVPVDGDRVYLRRNGELVLLRYSVAAGGWTRFGNRLATESFPVGSGFWYFRNTINEDTGVEWNP